jgi:hypothetical protein
MGSFRKRPGRGLHGVNSQPCPYRHGIVSQNGTAALPWVAICSVSRYGFGVSLGSSDGSTRTRSGGITFVFTG